MGADRAFRAADDGRLPGWLERERGLASRTSTPCGAGRSTTSRLLDLDGRLLRHPAPRPLEPRPGRPDDAGRPLVRGRRAQLRRGDLPAAHDGSAGAPLQSERHPLREVSRRRARDSVAAAAAGLRRLGVGRGDRVVGGPTEHSRGGRRVPCVRQPRRHLGQLLARLRHPRA